MRIVRAIDNEGDWTFGRSLNDYRTKTAAIEQNVVTRIKSFANDWFLDMSANIDYDNILGVRDNEAVLKSEILRVAKQTEGVLRIDTVDVAVVDRKATITLNVTTIYSKITIDNIEVQA